MEDLFEPRKNSGFGKLKNWLEIQSGGRQLGNPLMLALLLLATLPVSYFLSTLGLKLSVVAFSALISLPLVAFCLFNIPFAIGLMIFTAFALPFLLKFTSLPLGTLLDLLILLSGLGILLRQIKERDWSFARHPLSYMVLVWLFYNTIQVLNPEAQSRVAWLYTVRSVAVQQVVFFIAAYALKSRLKLSLNILKFIMALCFISALYGLKQQFFGFSQMETAWMMADELRYQLYYQWGLFRIPSFCYDPTTFGILMACFAVFCAALIIGPSSNVQKILLGIMLLCSLWAMAYTGTRTAFGLVPIGAAFFAGLIMSKRVLIIGGMLALLGTAFVLKSTSSGVIYRIQSAFKPSSDASMNLRLENQKKIQPLIQSKPFGMGLGSCGVWGKRFNPDSPLADFPHDSSFVRMGVELGWIGLLLYTLFHYVVLRTGLYYFVRCRDPFIKSLYAGITTWCFMLAVACYFQEAILQLPMNVLYNVFLGMLVTLKNFDPVFQKT
ncbi:MAG: O-antigen ligase family protein [Lewinellaceae bacterium]|nr:O-antigen ligase family protein [Saprospiraceae bacterium]MCB9345495.1 O-antigen ligase family protein [Lewinellaceae bacterium]